MSWSSPPPDPKAQPPAPAPGLAPREADLSGAPAAAEVEPVLCEHCGRTASNGVRCEGICVADSGY